MNDKWHIASVSFGKDSLAMLLLLLSKQWGQYSLDEVIFFDWGMEFQAIYNNRDKIKPLLQEKGIKFTELKYETSFEYNFCEKEVKKRNGDIQHGYGWCGGLRRWGTTFKNRVISNYYKTIDKEIVEYIGIAADEIERIPRAIENGKVLPLVDLGYAEKDCLEYCRSLGYCWQEGDIDLYDVMDRVSCWCCRNNNLKELRAMYHLLPQYWERLKELQEKCPYSYKEYKKQGIKYGSVQELEYRFQCEDAGIDFTL